MNRTASRRVGFAASLLALCAALPGCVSFAQPAVEKKQYVLEARRDGDEPSRAGGGVLDVRPFRVSPRLDGTRFVYRTGGDVFASDFYHVFWAAPQALVADETRRWVASSGLFEDVPDVASTMLPTYVLECALADLYGDYRPGETPKAVMSVRVALIDVRGALPHVVLSREYAAEVPLERADPGLLVAGWNTALRRILAELEADLRALPRR